MPLWNSSPRAASISYSSLSPQVRFVRESWDMGPLGGLKNLVLDGVLCLGAGTGGISLPSAGIGAIAEQLASTLPKGEKTTGVQLHELRGEGGRSSPQPQTRC